MTAADNLREQIDDLWQKHLPLMQSRVETIQLAINALQNDRLSEDVRVAAKEAAHKLAGSLGTFGLENASDDASQIERLLAGDVSAGNNTRVIDQYLSRIKQAIDIRGRSANSRVLA